jgi:two-component system sensor histidine kinase YesM
MLAVSFLMGLALTYYLNKRNFRNIRNIVSIIESAEKEIPLPPVPSRVEDEYGYIVQTIIKTFIERSFLKIQLSERMYKSKTIELLALQSQINPHFLFNTLETINWKVLGFTGKPNEANEMISSLSDILKYTLQRDEREVSVRDEIRYTESYIMIQKVRYRDKFEVVWNYDDDVLLVPIMKLLLQPLVENSIYHGIKAKDGKGTIAIGIKRTGGWLEISVADDGLGISPDRLAEIKSDLMRDSGFSAHIGLYNTNKRLRLQYGEDSGISIESEEGRKTTVRALIPCGEAVPTSAAPPAAPCR